MSADSRLKAGSEGLLKTLTQTDALFDILYRATSGTTVGDAALWAKRFNLTPEKLMGFAKNPKLYAGMAELGAQQILGSVLKGFGKKKKDSATQAANIDEENLEAANLDQEIPQAANLDTEVPRKRRTPKRATPKKSAQPKQQDAQVGVRSPEEVAPVPEEDPSYDSPAYVPTPEDEKGDQALKGIAKGKGVKKPSKAPADTGQEDEDADEEAADSETTGEKTQTGVEPKRDIPASSAQKSFDPFSEHGGRADEEGEAPQLGRDEAEQVSEEEREPEADVDHEQTQEREQQARKAALQKAQIAEKTKRELTKQLKDIEKDIADLKRIQSEFKPDVWWLVIPSANVILDAAQMFDGSTVTALVSVGLSVSKVIWYMTRGPEMKKFLKKRTTLMIFQWTLNAIPLIGTIFPTAIVEGYIQNSMRKEYLALPKKIEEKEREKAMVQKRLGEFATPRLQSLFKRKK